TKCGGIPPRMKSENSAEKLLSFLPGILISRRIVFQRETIGFRFFISFRIGERVQGTWIVNKFVLQASRVHLRFKRLFCLFRYKWISRAVEYHKTRFHLALIDGCQPLKRAVITHNAV